MPHIRKSTCWLRLNDMHIYIYTLENAIEDISAIGSSGSKGKGKRTGQFLQNACFKLHDGERRGVASRSVKAVTWSLSRVTRGESAHKMAAMIPCLDAWAGGLLIMEAGFSREREKTAFTSTLFSWGWVFIVRTKVHPWLSVPQAL